MTMGVSRLLLQRDSKSKPTSKTDPNRQLEKGRTLPADSNDDSSSRDPAPKGVGDFQDV